MDFIQKTIELFNALRQRIKDIGALLISEYLPSDDSPDAKKGLFWIFNW